MCPRGPQCRSGANGMRARRAGRHADRLRDGAAATRGVQVCEAEQRVGKRTVYESVAKTREIMVPVCVREAQQREGVRTVYERVPEQVTRRAQVCEMEPYTETVRVLVNGAELNGD